MSTTGTPGPLTTPNSGWLPILKGLGLPTQLVSAITQSYQISYSIRDTTNQHASLISHMIQYGTHTVRAGTNAQSVPDGALFFETDHGTIFYQARMNSAQTTRSWFLGGGLDFDVAANQPSAANLGSLDAGYLFYATDTNVLQLWNGTAWLTVG